ncbi:hypothetical protein CE91St44_26800 [Oscillospiraceae bacterium]|nr:hypothetical protein CE91St44_26800 [Oscillospiraceae bacterium]
MLWDKKDGGAGYNEEMFDEPRPGEGQIPAEGGPTRALQGEGLLARQLAPGETVIWQGRPQRLHGPAGAFGRLFGFVWLGFSCFWELMALTAARHGGVFGLVFPLFGVPFVLIGLNLVFPNLLGGRRRAGMAYAITNRRVLAVARGRVTAWPLSSVEGVEKRYYKDGTGDLVLGNGQTRTTWDDGRSYTHSVTMDFLGLADVDAAEAALRSQLMVP